MFLPPQLLLVVATDSVESGGPPLPLVLAFFRLFLPLAVILDVVIVEEFAPLVPQPFLLFFDESQFADVLFDDVAGHLHISLSDQHRVLLAPFVFD